VGYVEGKNILIEYGLAETKLDRLPVVAAQLVGLKVDIIVAVGGALAAKKATKTSLDYEAPLVYEKSVA
jgi:ABC-type uncharacterized transport system substrate-binding protein